MRGGEGSYYLFLANNSTERGDIALFLKDFVGEDTMYHVIMLIKQIWGMLVVMYMTIVTVKFWFSHRR